MKFAKGIILIALAVVAFIAVPLKAQVSGEFLSVELTEKNYQELQGATVIQPFQFTIPPNTPDLDDGYYKIDFGFPFEYNSEVYTSLWVSINGFATFEEPLFLIQADPTGLFKDLPSSYQENVLAPYWGDHYYRTAQDETNGYTRTTISWSVTTDQNGQSVLAIEWKDLNINDETIPSSIADFQLRLYESDDPLSPQGDVEFAYGVVGGNENDPSDVVITRGASVGIKGEGRVDFLNGLYPCDEVGESCIIPEARTETTLTNEWQPSGASNYRILFSSKQSFNVEEFWGDGDVDFSKVPGARHFNLGQSYFVTYNDIRLVLNAIATKVPLDSVRRRAAYHGDVTHNGRFYFRDNNGTLEKVKILRKDMLYWEGLPDEVTSIKDVYYEANEQDAAYMTAYLGAKVPYLPFLRDTMVNHGKQSHEEPASNLRFGNIEEINGVKRIPVYTNGYVNGPLSVKFDVNATVNNVELNNITDNTQFVSKGVNTVAFAGSGEYTTNEPIMYVELTNASDIIEFNGIRFNDNEVGTAKLSTETVSGNNELRVKPNVFSTETNLELDVVKNGNYTVAIYDALGNNVKTLFNGSVNSGTLNLNWNGTDYTGNTLSNGVYMVQVSGEGVEMTKKVILNK